MYTGVTDTYSAMPRQAKLHEAQIDTISYVELRKGSEVQAEKLFRVCKEDGIFYLDLTTVEEMHCLVGKLFDLPEEERMRFDIDKNRDMKGCG